MSETKTGSLVVRMAQRYGVDEGKMLSTLKATCFKLKQGEEVSNEQMLMLLQVAEEHNLNPFTKEIYAFPDKGGITAVVGVDGWLRIINEHPSFESLQFHYPDEYSEVMHKGKFVFDWIEVEIVRTDRKKPILVREYFDEVVRDTGPWGSHPKRMHRHKALVQCARVAFGFAGISDDDEAERIAEAIDMGKAVEVSQPQRRSRPAAPPAAIKHDPIDDGFVPPVGEIKRAEPVGAEMATPATSATLATSTAPASTSLKAIILQRLQGTGLELQAVCEEVGISNFENLTEDGFVAIKDFLDGLLK